MFGNSIKELTLTGPVADHAFTDIRGGVYQEDVTFRATARALLGCRGAKLRIFRNAITKYTTEELGDDGYLAYIKTELDEDEDMLMVADFSPSDDRLVPFVMEHSEEALPGFKFLETESQRLSKFCGGEDLVWIFVNAVEHKSVVFVREMNLVRWHTVQSALPLYMPWVFAGNKLDKDELEVLMALANPRKTSRDYISAVEKLAEKYDLQKAAKEYYLRNFENKAASIQIEDTRRRLSILESEICDYEGRLSDKYDQKAMADATLSALLNGTQEDSHELMDYFMSNKKLYVKGVVGNDVSYYVSGVFDNWDPDTFEYVFNNKRSVIFTAFDDCSRRQIDNKADFEQLIKAVFEDELIKIKVVSSWRVGFGCGIRPNREDEYPDAFADYIPNPHLHYHACEGGYREDLNRAAREHNYVRAVDISSFMNGNIGWNDSVVVPEFISDILKTKKKCFVLPDGTSVTNREAVEWLKAQDAQE